jgi:hypothetical protein
MVSPPGEEPARLPDQAGSTLTEERSKGEVVDTFKFAIINHPGLKK